MIRRGDGLPCPKCSVMLVRKWGCDWMRCPMCRTEICWVTRGPRWGPGVSVRPFSKTYWLENFVVVEIPTQPNFMINSTLLQFMIWTKLFPQSGEVCRSWNITPTQFYDKQHILTQFYDMHQAVSFVPGSGWCVRWMQVWNSRPKVSSKVYLLPLTLPHAYSQCVEGRMHCSNTANHGKMMRTSQSPFAWVLYWARWNRTQFVGG